MEKNQPYYDYEKSMIFLDDVLDLMEEAIENRKPLSLGRFGHIEIAYIGWSHFPHCTNWYEPYSSYSGATVSISTMKDDLIKSLKTTNIVGFHASWGAALEDQETAKLTLELLQYLDFRPKRVCPAFITHEMIKSDRFWSCLKKRKVALVGRRAAEAVLAFKEKDIDITYTTTLEGYEEIEKVYEDLSKREDWDIALLSAGIPATILAPQLANHTNRVVIDFGHALDKCVDGENFNYQKLLEDWKNEMDKKMLVSIVMAVYNGKRFLSEALDHVLSQTYSNLEVIIVNDGSTDSTKTILDAIDDKRVKVIHLEKNQGAANALNIGIREAKGSWIAIQDADDNSYPTRIEEQVKYIFEHPQLVGVGTLVKCISGSPDVSRGLLKGLTKARNSFVSRKQIRKKIYSGCPLTHSSVMFCKDVFLEVGGYNSDFKIAYDYDLWLRLLEKGEMENVPKVLLQYRIHSESLSHKDDIATLKEVQIASSRAICRLFKKDQSYRPRIIVTGPEKGCEYYKNHIASTSGLKVKTLIFDKDWNTQISYAIKKIQEGKIDAIIVLDGARQKNILNDLKSNNLTLNVQVFRLFNLLE